MREMKDSGIAWIGEIPKDWSVIPLKYLLSNEIDSLRVGPFGSELKSTDFTDDGYWVYNQRTVLDYNFTTNDTYISEEKYSTMAGFQIRPKDILITTRGTIGRICRVPDKFYKGVIHPCIIKFRINEDVVLYPYLELIFNSSSLFLTQLTYQSNATTIEVIYGGTLKNLMVPIPTDINLQKRISKYLIRRCNEIDNIIEDIQRQIEVLQEYKQSVITEAVTKGLDKDVAMKDSSEYVGKIPQAWNICKVKYVSDLVTDGAHISPDTSTEEYKFLSVTDMDDYGNLNFINCLQITAMQYNYFVKTGCKPIKDDVIISKDGTIGKTTVIETDEDFVVASSLVIIRPSKDKISAKYLRYCLMSKYVQEQLRMLLAGSALKRVSVSKNANLKIVYTDDINEQKTISNYLDAKCTDIDNSIADKQKQLDTLTEYKKSLIYEYVTGKKEVPADA